MKKQGRGSSIGDRGETTASIAAHALNLRSPIIDPLSYGSPPQSSIPDPQSCSTTRIAFASFIGTAIEFYDFYIYGLAVAMVIGPVFFPSGDSAAQVLNAFLTFGIAFLARPFGALLFGHFGDRIGRKATLVASLLVMGISTTLIGVLPSYEMVGWAAPLLLCLLALLRACADASTFAGGRLQHGESERAD